MSWKAQLIIICDDCEAEYRSPTSIVAAAPQCIDLARAEAGMLGWSYLPDPDPDTRVRNLDLCPQCLDRRLDAGGALIV